MRQRFSLFRAFKKDHRGATAVEFAVLAVPFFMLIMGIIEFGLFMMTKIAIESATTQAGRASSLGACNVACVQELIVRKTNSLINGENAVVTAGVVDSATAAGGAPFAGDLCLTTPPHFGGSCPVDTVGYRDLNHNGRFDGSASTSSLGGPGDLVEVRVSLPWHVLMPFLSGFFGEDGVVLITSNTVVKNESY